MGVIGAMRVMGGIGVLGVMRGNAGDGCDEWNRCDEGNGGIG